MKTQNILLPLAAFAAGALLAKSKSNSSIGAMNKPKYFTVAYSKYYGHGRWQSFDTKKEAQEWLDERTEDGLELYSTWKDVLSDYERANPFDHTKGLRKALHELLEYYGKLPE